MDSMYCDYLYGVLGPFLHTASIYNFDICTCSTSTSTSVMNPLNIENSYCTFSHDCAASTTHAEYFTDPSLNDAISEGGPEYQRR